LVRSSQCDAADRLFTLPTTGGGLERGWHGGWPAQGFPLIKSVDTLKLSEPPRRINPCDAREWIRWKSAMNDTLSAALIGAIAGYLIARHCPEIEWIVHTLIG
jgi:hypothetical protein